MNDFGNTQVKNLPNHLRQYIVDQHYEKYTPVDQAIWRYVMRQNYRYLKDVAHYPYIKGLAKAGLTIDRIPDLYTMNLHLGEIGWGAVTVDGFIPPVAFMEFQSYKVLVIAADIRQLHHIRYTPAPDIIHESAGHAPIIADPDYAEYLRYFGEIGSKAMFSKEDFELYDAIRKLSILKEQPGSDPMEIEKMENLVLFRQNNMGEPSEMALLSRLHWWTVEYGLIGTLEEPKIYGAGLLSSIGESVSCMNPEVKKLWYTAEAVNTPFDITKEQPQLFVTPDFPNLLEILDDFASRMSFRKGGIEGLKKAKACRNVSTLVLSSGLQISGILDDFEYSINSGESYQIELLKLVGPSSLAFENKELLGLGNEIFKNGMVIPLGNRLGMETSPELETRADLQKAGIIPGKEILLQFQSGIKISGILIQTIERKNKIILLKMQGPEMTRENGEILFKGNEDTLFYLPLGSQVISVFNGAADKDAFYHVSLVSETHTPPPPQLPDHKKRIHKYYGSVGKLREEVRKINPTLTQLEEIWKGLQDDLEETWLCALELLEICIIAKNKEELENLGSNIRIALSAFILAYPDYSSLIEDGLETLLVGEEFYLEKI